MCASVEVPCYVHPSRCCILCILRGALRVCILRGVLMCASVEVPCYVHPSRCCVLCILRVALLCASFGVLYFVHHSRCLVVGCARGLKKKHLHPFWYIPPGGLLGNVGLGNTRAFCFWRKTSPPLASVLSQGIFSKVAFCRGKFPSVKIGRLLLVAECVLREVVVVRGTLVRVVFL